MGAECTHRDVTHVFNIMECEVWGGRETQVMPRANEFDVLICLLGHMAPKPTAFKLSRGSARMFSSLTKYQQRRNNILSIDWPDMSVPKLDKGFWLALVEDLSAIKGKVAIFCMGGHGRTGTALTCLMKAANYTPAEDIVEWLRANYCADAVESKSQIDYLKRVMGVDTKLPPSNELGQPKWIDRGFLSAHKGGGGISHYFKGKQAEFGSDFEESID